jgi:NAD(P)-dependent dehydrogenase (short-subunit alcohol dehydrogenase family)
MENAPLLVVGGTGGIGRRIVERALAAGVPVVTAGRRAEAPSGVQAHLVCDVAADGLPAEALPEVLRGLVYCPGSIDLKPLRSLRAEDVRAALEVNAVGAFRAAQVCADRLKKYPGSAIVLFSTVAVGRGMPFHAGVAMAKGAVEGLTRSLAAELAPTVRVNCIAPSLTRTPLASKLLGSPEREEAAAQRHPLKRVGEPDDIAAMALFLAGPEAGWITGQVIGVDGGMSAM